jgi:hypothetical protein
VVDQGMSWLENPIITKVADPALARSEETGIEPAPGAETPNFTLVNQDGKQINFNQYRGQNLVLTFIYTRCPLPDYCPLMSENFAKIKAAVDQNAALKAKTHLLSIRRCCANTVRVTSGNPNSKRGNLRQVAPKKSKRSLSFSGCNTGRRKTRSFTGYARLSSVQTARS